MSHDAEPIEREHGLMAEFEHAHDLVQAAEAVHNAGYTKMDAYSPFPIEGLAECMGMRKTGITKIALCAGIIGGCSGYLLEYFCAAIAFPLNVAGRPLNDIPTFIPVVFECTVLFAGLSTAFSMLLLNGLPQPYHPVFNVERFVKRASRDGFFLVIEKKDPMFKAAETKELLKKLKASGVYDVEA